MKTLILVRAREVYGNVLYYPHNEQAHKATMLTGKTTLRRQDLEVLRQMGFTVAVEAAIVGGQLC